MTGGLPELEDRLSAAIAALDAKISRARQDLVRYQRENQPTPEQLRALHEQAQRGDLGFDMEELARKVDEGQDSWAAVLSGTSPDAELLRTHLQRMIERNREAVAAALEEDPDFDPGPPDEVR